MFESTLVKSQSSKYSSPTWGRIQGDTESITGAG